MFSNFKRALFLGFIVVSTCSVGLAQAKPGDGTFAQRLEIMRDKLDRLRRSVSSTVNVIREENKDDKSKKDDEKKLETPLGRMVALEKDASRVASDVNNLRGKVDRGEKVEKSDIDAVEQLVGELQSRIDTAQLETATARATPDSPVGKPREKKKKKKFLGIFGGGGSDEYEELLGSVSPGRDRELFIVATREVRNGNYDVGRLLFQTIITTYPDSPYLPMSKLAVGDSFYLEGSTSSLIQAIGSYQDWLTFFPTHPLSCRVILKIAEAEMRQVGLPDRDATRAKRAETRLKALLQQCPDSYLKADTDLRLKQVQDNLGLHNLLIANYYYALSIDQKKGGLKGSQSRFREIIDKYPNFSFMDEVLYKLAVTYLVEEETDQAARYFQRIVADYPNSEYVAKAKEQLGLIGATIPQPNPARMNVLPPEDVSFFQNFKNQFFGIYPMTIDKDGVLMTKDFRKEKFELIDQIIEGGGEILVNQIPQALTTVISQRQPGATQPKPVVQPTPQK
ncbi:MAG TPA: outer membrane protein assembly factor BamD [Pyrinomonadaceae bacterium]|nr:outer membrane protein assembly factor BamD [Pyrinomonadaceae bacterium]